ncbi:hypothetical protein F4780DRAFT_787889 [Xylariomycetidae sp. FL0641]|nr:hypothetical protein F4780DRAFT_787889 [Xylariomycetidae sp. FL0641]
MVGLDHPYDQACVPLFSPFAHFRPFIRFPDGSEVGGTGWDKNVSDADVEGIYRAREEDFAALFAQLPDLPARRLGGMPLGALGDVVVSGLNLDGSFFGRGNSSAADVGAPVFLFGHQAHNPCGFDVSWDVLPREQTGYLRVIEVNGTRETDLCDNAFWKTLGKGPSTDSEIDGFRMINITNAYFKAFFDFTLLGKYEPLLDRLSPLFSEVVFWDRPYGTV